MKEPFIKPKILVVDDEERIRTILEAVLADEGYDVQSAKDGVEALKLVRAFHPHLVIVDLQMPRMDGLEVIARIKEIRPATMAIILTAHGTIQSAVQAIKQGAYDYLTKPFDNEQILLVVKRAVDFSRVSAELDELKGQLQRDLGPQAIVGNSPPVADLRDQIRQIAATDATVLIEGESGTGKELAARAIYHESKRAKNPLVVIDCAAIPSTLVETEFFGYEPGAFTDARELRLGKFAEADTGTVFLDEVGELPLEAQSKLLRVLQEKEFARVGATRAITVDVRVIAATNKDLYTQVKQGKFREDLYYRLNVLRLRVPSLSEHADDIPVYANHFIEKYKGIFGKKVTGLSDGALRTLKAHVWKGNVRELENAIQRALLAASGDRIEDGDLAFLSRHKAEGNIHYDPNAGLESYIRDLSEEAERQIIFDTLNQTHWNRTDAATRLKISRKTLFNKMLQYGLEQEIGR